MLNSAFHSCGRPLVRPGRRGYSLVELLIVVAIMAALVASAVGLYANYVAQDTADTGSPPAGLAQLAPWLQTRSLVGRSVPVDPWHNAYEVVGAQVRSHGPDGQPATGDDIVAPSRGITATING